MEKFNAEWKKQMIENENTASQLTQKERVVTNLENQKKMLENEFQKKIAEIEELRDELKQIKLKSNGEINSLRAEIQSLTDQIMV